MFCANGHGGTGVQSISEGGMEAKRCHVVQGDGLTRPICTVQREDRREISDGGFGRRVPVSNDGTLGA